MSVKAKNELRIPIGKVDAVLELLGNKGWHMVDDEILFTGDIDLVMPTAEELSDCIAMLDLRRTQSDTNDYAREYLQETDWYVIRLQETGEVIPQEIIELRAQARLDVIEI